MSMRDKIEHAIQNQPCTVKELKQKFGGERGADRKHSFLERFHAQEEAFNEE